MTHLQFENEEASNSTRTLFLSNHGLQIPVLNDINRLKFLLGVTPFSSTLIHREEDRRFDAFEMESILHRFTNIPFYDPVLLKIFIWDTLGFDFHQANKRTLIWLQWTILLFFIQMCLPINFSAIEGGHRTWSIILLFAGCPFNTKDNFRDRHSAPLFRPSPIWFCGGEGPYWLYW